MGYVNNVRFDDGFQRGMAIYCFNHTENCLDPRRYICVESCGKRVIIKYMDTQAVEIDVVWFTKMLRNIERWL